MEKIIEIEGMSCEHCAKRIEHVLKNMEGITDVNVSLDKKEAIVKGDTIDTNIIKDKIENIGFNVKNIK